MKAKPHTHYVLAVYPSTKGFAFVLFSSPLAPYDWGVKSVRHRDKNRYTLREVVKLLEYYRPDVVIIEDTSERGTRRSARIRRLYRLIASTAEAECIEVYAYPKAAVQACFAKYGAVTKQAIAEVIAAHIEAFSHRLPPKRKIWQSIDPRQSLFDAAALGLTWFAASGRVFDQ